MSYAMNKHTVHVKSDLYVPEGLMSHTTPVYCDNRMQCGINTAVLEVWVEMRMKGEAIVSTIPANSIVQS